MYVECGEAGLVVVRAFGEHRIEPSSTVFLRFDPLRVMMFDADGGRIRQ
ncbi:MAG: hypothetical protein M9905_12850 [Rhizobiaceae bacterium]|nr:hypothetical protein [Rhizobiaceae bacterium]